MRLHLQTRPAQRQLSLTARIAIAGFAVVALGVASTAWFLLRQAAQDSERSALEAEAGRTERIAAELSSRLAGRQAALVATASALQATASALPQRTGSDGAAALEFLGRQAVLLALFDSVSIIATDGAVLASIHAPLAQPPAAGAADPRLAQRAADPPAADSAFVSGSDPRKGGSAVVLSAAVPDAEGRAAAVLAGSVGLDSLLGDLRHRAAGDQALTVVVDSAGRFVAHPDRRALVLAADGVPRLAQAFATRAAAGSPAWQRAAAERFGGDVVATAGVEGVGGDWLVMRSTPAATLFAGARAGLERASWFALAVAIGGGAILALVCVVMLRPLHRLEKQALRLLDEDHVDDTDWPETRGAVGTLSRALRHVVVQRTASLAANKRALGNLQAVLDHAPVGIAFSANRKFGVVSRHFGELVGYACDQLEGESPRLIYASDEFYADLGQRVGAAFAEQRVFDEEVEFVRRDGNRFWGRLKGSPVRHGDPAAGTIWTVADVTAERAQRERLSWDATHDALTGLVNRAEFEARLAEQLRDRRGEPACALFIDLDRFKAVNDNAGHAAGDALLKDVTAILTRSVRGSDTVARLGGDEFAVLLRGCDHQGAARVAELMRAGVEALRFTWDGRALEVGASIGLAPIDEQLIDGAAVVAAADAACYAAKHAGRNRVHSHGTLKLVATRY